MNPIKDKSKRILITGTSGFIGKNLVKYLSPKEETVLFCPNRDSLNLLNASEVKDFFKSNKIDVVIHTANVNNTKHQGVTYEEQLDGNLRMFFNLLSCSEYYTRMIYFGSGAEYDQNHYLPKMSEEYFGKNVPNDSYGFSKYIMSCCCHNDSKIFDLRLFGVYGPYEEYTRRFISNAICRALKGMDITIHKNVFFDYLWIDDLCELVYHFVWNDLSFHHYNVCRGHRVDLLSLAEMVREECEVCCDIVIEEEGFKAEYSGDNSRMLSEVGDFKFTSYRESINKLVGYYKNIINDISADEL